MAKRSRSGQNYAVPTVIWLPEALTDIQRLHAFLQSKSPEAAAKAAAIIMEGAIQLRTLSRIGRPMPDETGRRELFMAFGAGAYVIRYIQQDASTVVVIRVWHSREDRGYINQELLQ